MGLMQGLAGWLKQIIAVMLLATLIDLLLPNKTMQRYVRLVAGLFILLTVAAPVLQWMKGDFSSELAAGLKSVESIQGGSADELKGIHNEGLKLKERQLEEAGSLMTRRLEEAIRAGIEQSEGFPVREVDAVVERQSDGRLAVKEVTVTLGLRETAPVSAGKTAAEPGESFKPVEEVQPVEPVTVEIPQDKRTESAVVSAGQADRQTSLRIMTYLSANYGIPAERVKVVQPAPNDG